MYTPVVEDYLKTIWKLQQQGEGTVATSAIAEQLALSAAAVTAMVKRLAEQRLVAHEPYYGVRLTGAGELAALRIIRRHRVLELFLQEVLGYQWDRVHDEAERLEHAASDELIERLAALLGDPARDPHGAAIPSPDGEIDTAEHPVLAEVPVGQPMKVLEVRTGDAEHLRYLGSLELYPGIDLVAAGKLAMGQSIGTRLPADLKTADGQIGVMVMPVYGKGKLAGQPLLDVQGLGISSNAEDPKAAAAFLEFLNSPEQLKAFWDATGWIPSNTTFDTSVITDQTVRSMWENWGLKANISNVTNVMPGQFYERAAIRTGQQIVQGSMTGEQAGELAANTAKEWREFNPDLVEKYQKWAVDLSAA